MHEHSLARGVQQNRERRLLIIARSASLLARAALSGDYQALVIDAFGDRDTRAAAIDYRILQYRGEKIEPASLFESINSLTAIYGDMPILWGSGWEASGHILCALAARREVLGSKPDSLNALCNPLWLQKSTSTRREGTSSGELSNLIAAVRFENDDASELLIKGRARAGGHAVRMMSGERFLPSSKYFQPFLSGRSISALCLADGHELRILGWSEHFKLQNNRHWPFRHSAVVTIPAVNAQAELLETLRLAVQKLGLFGLFGCDFIEVANGQLRLVDLNPRPTATVPLHIALSEIIDIHLMPHRVVAAASGAAASAIVYADVPIRIPKKLDWPAWAGDLPDEARVFHSAEPICTICSRANTSDAARGLLTERFNDLMAMLQRSS